MNMSILGVYIEHSHGERQTGFDPEVNCVQSIYELCLRWMQQQVTVSVPSRSTEHSRLYAADFPALCSATTLQTAWGYAGNKRRIRQAAQTTCTVKSTLLGCYG